MTAATSASIRASVGSAPSGSRLEAPLYRTIVARAIVFDFNGTLSDDEGVLCTIFRELFAEQGSPLSEQEYFDELAGKFGRQYVPGRSWKGIAEAMLKLMPPMVIADLGAGEGTLALMLAQSAERVIAVDSSRKMVEYGLDLVARKDRP